MDASKSDSAREILVQAEVLSKVSNKEAISRAKEAYSRALDEGDNLTKLKSLVLMGRCAFMLGRTSDAIKWLLECISTAETLGLPEQLAEAYNQLGNTYQVINDYGRSISCYLDALDIIRDNRLIQLEGSILNNIGALYMSLEDYDRAADYFQQSYEKDKTVSNTSVILLLNLASIYAKKRAFEKTDKYMASAREALNGEEELLMTAWCSLTEGEICQAKGDMSKAIEHYKEAISVCNSTGDIFNECDMGTKVGQLLMEAGNLDDALKVLTDTYGRCDELKSNDMKRKIALLIAKCYTAKGKDKESLKYYKLHSVHVEQAENEHVENQRNSVLLQVQQHETNLERLRLKQLSEELMRTTEELKEAYATMERQAIIDSLTGIRNRRSMDAMLDISWKACQDGSKPFTLMLVDLDCFKNYNDYYGHPAGDSDLRNVAQALQAALGDERLIGRFGGDEFIAVLPEVSGDEARVLGNRMLDNIRNLRIPHERNEASSIQTVTIGAISLIPGKDDSQGNVLHMADSALYEGKKQGKDRLVLYCRE